MVEGIPILIDDAQVSIAFNAEPPPGFDPREQAYLDKTAISQYVNSSLTPLANENQQNGLINSLSLRCSECVAFSRWVPNQGSLLPAAR
jgi:hypothetical protein